MAATSAFAPDPHRETTLRAWNGVRPEIGTGPVRVVGGKSEIGKAESRKGTAGAKAERLKAA